jgi:hypothetical protein
MPKKTNVLLAWFAAALAVFLCARSQAQAAPQGIAYPAMAPLDRYLTPSDIEIALARSAAPKSISDDAQVMVLGPHGYTTVAKGSNGFLCLVERSWGNATDNTEFWNPRMRAPICFNPAAAKTFAPIYLMKTTLVLEGKSRSEISRTIASALDKNELPALQPGAMCYMMSKQQYLNDRGKNWHPHLMFYVAGDAAKTWGAGLPGSPVIAANDPEEHATIFMVLAGHWSDGTPYSPTVH